MVLALVVLGRNQYAADGQHLPLEAGELLVGLEAIEVGDCSVGCGGIKREIFTHVHHPLGYDLAVLWNGGRERMRVGWGGVGWGFVSVVRGAWSLGSQI